MITKYTRKQINVKTILHNKEFVIYDDIETLLTDILNAAVDAGADMDKLKGLIDANT